MHQFPGLDMGGVRPKLTFGALNGSFHLNAIDYFVGNCTSYHGLRGSGCGCDFRKLDVPNCRYLCGHGQAAGVKLKGLSWQAQLGAAFPNALVNKNTFERHSRRPFYKANRSRTPPDDQPGQSHDAFPDVCISFAASASSCRIRPRCARHSPPEDLHDCPCFHPQSQLVRQLQRMFPHARAALPSSIGRRLEAVEHEA